MGNAIQELIHRKNFVHREQSSFFYGCFGLKLGEAGFPEKVVETINGITMKAVL
jgi:hypothetical protein